jgi:hypothetical protein
MADEPSGVSVWTPKIADEALIRKFLSLNGMGYIAIAIQASQSSQTGSIGQAVAVDPDPQTLQVVLWFNDVLDNPAPNLSNTNPYGVQVATVDWQSITRIETGKYYYDIGPALTANRGLITAVWTYTVNGVGFQFTDHLQILDPMPFYDSLDQAEKLAVEMVSWQFGDMYDATEGGSHLIEEFQTHWNFERIAQMMAVAVQKMNLMGNFGNMPTNWSIGNLGNPGYMVAGEPVTFTETMPNGTVRTTSWTTRSSYTGGNGVPAQFFPLVVWGTYVECLRHFRDSYTELPNRPGMDAVYTDRTQYQQRWASNLQAEEPNYRQAVIQAKMSLLNLSRGSMLVAGGIYGGSALGIFQAGTYAAQVRSWRFYPAAPAISFGATSH